MNPWTALRTWFARRTLRWKLLMVTAVTLICTMVLFAVTSLLSIRQVMTEQIDRQLSTTASLLAREVLNSPNIQAGASEVFPSEYYVRYVQLNGSGQDWYSTSTFAFRELPAVTDRELTENPREPREPFTVESADGTLRWRMVTGPVTQYFQQVGVVAIALPLDGVENSAAQLSRLLSILGLSVATLGLIGVYFAVRKSLQPLHHIEVTAGKIADGDLSQRVPMGEHNTEVGHLARSINTMLGQIEDSFAAREASNERMRQFIADASHELRTPLSSVRGYSELYRLGAITEEAEVADTFARIEGSAVRMGDLVEGLLTLARLDADRPASIEHVDIVPLIQECVQEVEAGYPGYPITAATVEGSEPLMVAADEGWLYQIIKNLLVNACVHTPPGTAISVSTRRMAGQVICIVSDAGPGILPEHQARIFERFYRADPSRTRASGGSGLGLAIVSSLLTSMNGSITLESAPGEGTVFTVQLPVGEAADADVSVPAAPHYPQDS